MLFPDSARCQTESFEDLPSLPSPVEDTLRIPAGGRFDISTLPPGTFERDARGEGSAEQDTTGSSPQPQIQTQKSDHQGLVMRSVKRTLEDQKELYRAPFKPSNFKWDALVLGGTAALLATDRHIEKHIGNAHYTFYQATSDVAIAGLGATALTAETTIAMTDEGFHAATEYEYVTDYSSERYPRIMITRHGSPAQILKVYEGGIENLGKMIEDILANTRGGDFILHFPEPFD